MHNRLILALALALPASAACAPVNSGVMGSSEVSSPGIDGTVFTIIMENENAQNVIHPSNPTFFQLAGTYATADAYVSATHPSLPNYIELTSGQTHGISNSEPPTNNVRIPGIDNLADQLDAGGVPWRAYMEDMGTPCNPARNGEYVPNHNPFLYYRTMMDSPARCREHIVDFEEHFAEDLASGDYRFMWITPNQCHNMHDCPGVEADNWLAGIIAQIIESPGYRAGGVIFVIGDEGHLRIGGASANVPAIIVSERLVHGGMHSDTRFDHNSYLATIEDIFDLPRISTTRDATPMAEFFVTRAAVLDTPEVSREAGRISPAGGLGAAPSTLGSL